GADEPARGSRPRDHGPDRGRDPARPRPYVPGAEGTSFRSEDPTPVPAHRSGDEDAPVRDGRGVHPRGRASGGLGSPRRGLAVSRGAPHPRRDRGSRRMAEPRRLIELARAVAVATDLPAGPQVVALSGGADSAALLWLCRHLEVSPL